MKTCDDCGSEYIDGVCENCGLEDAEWQDIDDHVVIHDGEIEEIQHGPPRSNSIINMAVMTVVNPEETNNPNLKRALKKDGWFGWNVQKSIYINNELKRLAKEFNTGYLFIDDCYYYLRKYKDKLRFTGKSLEDVIPSLLYLFMRLNGQPFSLLDFKKKKFDTRKIYRIYMEMVKTLGIYKKIKPQNSTLFVEKAVDYIYNFNRFYPQTGDLKKRWDLINFIKEQFVGIYRRSTSVGFIDISENGLSTIGAILYVTVKNQQGFELTQKEVVKACEITEVTLRKYIKKLKNYYRTLEN